MSISTSTIQKENVDDVVVTQSTDVTQYLQNTTIEDLSILISSLEVVSNDSVASSIVKKEEDNIIINKNILSKLVETTVTLHVWNEFTRYLHRKYPEQIPEGVFQAEIDAAFLDIVNKFNSQESTTTSSTSLLFDGNTPRKDCLDKLSNIAISFSEQDEYPLLKIKAIKEIIKNNVGKDSRTQKKYFECIKQYSTPIRDDYWNLLSYDVERFHNLIPRELLHRERS